MFLRSTLRARLVALALSCTVMHPASSQPESRAGVRAAADNPFDVETGQACAERDRQISRLLQSGSGERFKGPAPDRKDIAYGSHPREKLDVFLPRKAGPSGTAPVIVMVHGGGWCVGDKGLKSVTANKIGHWLPKGFMLVTVNYPMLPDGRKALAQAEEVARAIAYIQQHVGEWGGDERRIVLMGHSAGAHLVSLVNADPALRASTGVKPALGVVSIDSGATNVVVQMQSITAPNIKARFAEAFGNDENGWKRASPFHQLDRTAAPWLGICSTRRKDDPCSQAKAYVEKSRSLGVAAAVKPVDKGHGALNAELGLDGDYTVGVDDFIASLEPSLRTALGR